MRILFLAHRLPYPPDKGDKIRSFRELEAMTRHHEVDLFCFYDQSEDCAYFPDVRRYCRELYAEQISWLRSRGRAALACASQRSFTTAFFHSPTMARHIREAASERNYDLVFVYGSSMAPYTDKISRLPRILDMVDVDSDKWSQYARHSRRPVSSLWSAEARRLSECEIRWAREFSVTLLSTRAEAELLRQRAPGTRIEVLENRMDAIYFNPESIEVPPEIAAWQPYVIFTGSMDYFPNVDAVTTFHRDVFPMVRAQLPVARFVIAGRNPSRAVRRLARDPAVSVTGSVKDIRPYLRGASVAVAPLRVARGIQNKIFEAMAMGLPVAVSSKTLAALPENLAKKVCVQDDPRHMAAFLIDALRTAPSLHSDVRQALLEYAGNLNWEERWESLLQRATATLDESAA
jgi:sugar transferase (PEP-CTERM/EpsH1 system associated)